jgi:DNA-directed RNA polymerase subunit beta'
VEVAVVFYESSIITKFKGKLEIEDLKLLKGEDSEGNAVGIVSRSTELKLVDQKTGILLNTHNIPLRLKYYGERRSVS